MPVKPVPEGYHTVTPYLTVDNAAALIDFLKRAFNASEYHVVRGPDGSVGHADLLIGDSHVMIGQSPGNDLRAMIYMYVPDADAMYRQAIAAGGESIHEMATHFYGDRHGAVRDSFGNQWWIATHVEDVAEDELQRRAAEAMKQRQQATV
jgi:PhnB protein